MVAVAGLGLALYAFPSLASTLNQIIEGTTTARAESASEPAARQSTPTTTTATTTTIVHRFADEFSTEDQGDLADSDQTNNWRYMWRESYNFDATVNDSFVCGTCSARQEMPEVFEPPVRALRWLVRDQDRGWYWDGAGIDELRGWRPRYDKRVVVGWTSTYDGSVTVNIAGAARLAAPGGSVRLAIYKGDNEQVAWTDVTSTTPVTIAKSDVLMHPGDELLFMVDAKGTDLGDDLDDRILWDPTITVLNTVATVHDSSVEYRNEQANLVNDVHSDDWLYEYKFSITDRTTKGNENLPVSWSADSSNLFGVEHFWQDEHYNSGPDDIHDDDPESRVWGINWSTRGWAGYGHNLHIGPDWMQPTYGLDAVKTWVNTYPEIKQVRLRGTVTLASTTVSGQGDVRVLVMSTTSQTGSTVHYDGTRTNSSGSGSYDVTVSLSPGDRVHFLAHQVNDLNNGYQEGRTKTDAHRVEWTPKVEIVSSTPFVPAAAPAATIKYPPSISYRGISWRAPMDNGEALLNRDMGIHHGIYDNALFHYGGGTPPSDTLDFFEGMNVVYIRVPWSFVQQEDDKYAWARIDEIMDYWGLKGKQAGFRFTANEQEHQATPVYLKEELGVPGNYRHGLVFGDIWVPEYYDETFLREYQQLLEAFVERYGDDPRIAYVEVGQMGLWGEGSRYPRFAVSSLRDPATWAANALIFNNAFEHTDIQVLWPDDLGAPEVGRTYGFGVFEDSIGFYTSGAPDAELVWRDAAIRVEMGHLFEPGRASYIADDPLRLLRVLETYHASHYFPHGFPDRYYAWYSNLAEAVNTRIGYRFNITEAFWDESTPPGQPTAINLGIRNAGVAPDYKGGNVGIVISNRDPITNRIRKVETIYRGFDTKELEVASSQRNRHGYSDAEVTRLNIPIMIPADFPTGMADVAVFIRRPQDYGIRWRTDRPLPVVGDWLDYPWEYYELPYANRVEHADNAFSYVIGQINVDTSATVEGINRRIGASPVTRHRYIDEFSAIQGTNSDAIKTNNWKYYSSPVNQGEYEPLAEGVFPMAYTNGKWTRRNQGLPEIRASGIHPDNGHDAVLAWSPDSGNGPTQALISAAITRHSDRGDGVRVSLVKYKSPTSKTVVWGPQQLTDGLLPISLRTQLGADESIMLVINRNNNLDMGWAPGRIQHRDPRTRNRCRFH